MPIFTFTCYFYLQSNLFETHCYHSEHQYKTIQTQSLGHNNKLQVYKFKINCQVLSKIVLKLAYP